jgi:predicted DNA-binding transcriptional regulator YafY
MYATHNQPMRSQRLLSCLLLLQGTRRRSARELAQALEVSIRTIYRDVDALSQAGVPIHMERGSGGGVVLANDYQRTLSQFSADELRVLFAARADPLADLGLAARPQALEKLAGALPVAQRRVIRDSRERLLLDQNRWYRGTQPKELLARLNRAVAADRCLKLTYRDREGNHTERDAEPLGLVAKAGVWYLVARVASGEYRTFRAERIVAADEIGTVFQRPAGFDLDAYWQQTIATVQERPSEDFLAVVRVRTNKLERVAVYWHTEVIEDGPEWTTLRARFANREMAAIALLALGADVDLLEPKELVERIVACAQEALQRYGTALR